MRRMLLLALVAGCGNGGGGGEAGLVTVTITQDGAPRAGIAVTFQNADQSFVGTIETDANGAASETLTAGGFVTTFDPFDHEQRPNDALYTIGGVQPGDTLVFDAAMQDAYQPIPPPPGPMVTLTVPAHTDGGGPMVYCGGGGARVAGGTPDTVALPGCEGKTRLLVISYEGSRIYGALWATVPPIADGATIDLSANAYEPPSPQTITATSGSVSQVVDAIATPTGIDYLAPTASASSPSTLDVPPLDGATVIAQVEVDGTNDDHYYLRQFAPTVGDVTFDASTQLFGPAIAGPAFDADGVASWTASEGPVPDFALIEAVAGPSVTHYPVLWYLALPVTADGTTQSAAAPTLAGSLARFTLQTANGIDVFERWQLTGGWDAARPLAMAGAPRDVIGRSGAGTASGATR